MNTALVAAAVPTEMHSLIANSIKTGIEAGIETGMVTEMDAKESGAGRVQSTPIAGEEAAGRTVNLLEV